MSAFMGRGTGSSSGLKGTGFKQFNSPTLNPEQQQLFSQLLGGSKQGISKGLGNLSSLAGGDEQAFNQLEAPALRQFSGLQGNIASRFSGQGSGARKSSGFQNTMSGAAGDFAERLQSQRMGLQQNAIKELLGLGESLLGTKTFETNLIEKKKKKMPWWQSLMATLGGGASGNLAGGFTGGIGQGYANKILGNRNPYG